MAKRKREATAEGDAAGAKASAKKAKPPPKRSSASAAFKLGDGLPLTIQIVAGSYDRVLHGVTATVNPATKSNPKSDSRSSSSSSPPQHVDFADTFLFNAHNSAIRCLALSPPSAPAAPGQSQKVLLATGSTDERINIYNLSAHPPPRADHHGGLALALSAAAPRPILENPAGNRELGTLLHHGASVTRLAFPSRAKLLSAAEDATVAVTRTRDWTLLHAFRCPVPKATTAQPGRVTASSAQHGGGGGAVNDFAVHPSSRIMISVGKGERCMRLWNLETGKKSRVLNFERAVLAEIGEAGRHATGEARRIVWGSSCSSSAGGEDGEGDEEEEEFAVGFDRDVLVFGMDCRPRCRLMRDTRTKVHELRYVETDADKGETVLAVSTEDGRVLFFSTAKKGLEPPPEGKTLPVARLVAQLGGKEAGVSGRVKDFTVLPAEDESGKKVFFIVTGSSDGRIRLWQVGADDLGAGGKAARQVGKLLGTYETQNRITCVGAFIMIPRPEGAEESEYEFDDSQEEDDAEDSDDE